MEVETICVQLLDPVSSYMTTDDGRRTTTDDGRTMDEDDLNKIYDFYLFLDEALMIVLLFIKMVESNKQYVFFKTCLPPGRRLC